MKHLFVNKLDPLFDSCQMEVQQNQSHQKQENNTEDYLVALSVSVFGHHLDQLILIWMTRESGLFKLTTLNA